MLMRYAEQLLNLYNYIDGIIVTNRQGIIEYYKCFRQEINNLKEEEVLGKYILEIYPTLTEETSTILNVLKTEEPVFNLEQDLRNYRNQPIYAINTTLPIKVDGKTIGAVEISRYKDPALRRKNVSIVPDKKNENRKNDNLYCLDDIITGDPYMLKVKQEVHRIAQTDSSVLVFGATGTGKELVAQSIHNHSDRSARPFISQNCAAIPSTLLESILFGTVKGSYTGAENQEGLFEMADGGTLFLDEINSMETTIQAKLLKAIEEKKIRRLGGKKEIKVDVRIIAAVNEDPFKAIENNKLREDLFYRIAVVQINLPPLRERRKDVKLLTNYFINYFNKTLNKKVISISKEVEDLFAEYHWPGNIRELKNIIENAFNLTANNLIEKRDLPQYLLANSRRMTTDDDLLENHLGELPLKDIVENYEKNLLLRALAKTASRTEAAALLQISKQALNYKLKKYMIHR